MKKIFLFLLLAVACNLSMSAQERFTVGKLTYEPVTVDGVDGWIIVEPAEVITGELVIPREVTYNGVTKPVLVIGEEAFIINAEDNNTDVRPRADRAKGITNLTFEAGSLLKIIRDRAFLDVDMTGSLSGTITIPASVDSIGESVFYTKEKLDVIRFEYGSKIKMFDLSYYYTKKLYLPKSVTSHNYRNQMLAWTTDDMYVEWDGDNIPFIYYYRIFGEDGYPDVAPVKHMTIPMGTMDAYKASEWYTNREYRFEFTEITLEEHKDVQKAYVDDFVRRALWGEAPSTEVAAIISSVKERIDNASNAKAASDALQYLEPDMLIQCKREKTEHIKALLNGVENKYLNSIAAEALKNIPILNDYNEINHYYYACVPKLEAAMQMYYLASAPTTSGAGLRMKITKNDDTVWEFKLTDKMGIGTEVVSSLSASDVNAFAFTFAGEGNPIEKEHYLEGKEIIFGNGGEEMTFSANGATITYSVDKVPTMTLFHGTPSVALTATEDPNNAGKYYTTFYSGLEAYSVPAGVTAYKAEVDGNNGIFTPIAGSVISQDEAVMLYSEESAEMTLEIAPNDVMKNDGNQLQGVDVQSVQQPGSKYFTLSYAQDKLGFHLMSNTAPLAANRAYLALSADVQTESFRMILSDKEDICGENHHYVVELDDDGNAVWIWDELTSAMLQLVCTRNPEHRSEVVATGDAITNAVTVEPACTTDGERTYTATLTYDGVEYTSTKTETMTALGHDYLQGICQRCDDSPSHFDVFALTDGTPYLIDHDCDVVTLTYTRTFFTNVWNAWFVPFDMTVSELAENGVTDVACIESIHNYDMDEDGVVDKTVLEVILKKAGTVKAGVPYMVKAGEDYTYPMTFAGMELKASTDTKTVHTETGSAAYDFMGTYSGLTADEVNAASIFNLNSEGAMVHRTGSILPQRWYMKEVSKENVYEELSPAMTRAISILVIGEEDETTGIRTLYPEDQQTEELLPVGIFDLSGRKLSVPQRGKINIINGKKHFVK